VKYSHTVIYWIKGLSPSQAENSKEIIINLAVNFQLVLTSSPDTYCFEGDRHMAVAGLLLNGMFGLANSGTFEERLEETLLEIKESRKQKFGIGVYLIFLRRRKINTFSPSHERELESFVVCFDGASKQEIQLDSEPKIQAALSALTLAIDNVLGITKVSDSVVFFREDGKPIYSYTGLAGSAKLFVSQPISISSVESLLHWYEIVDSDAELERVNRLLLSSLQTEDDALRSFLFAWNALEIFINKIFGFYELKFFEELNVGNYPNARRNYFERIRTVMKDKYKLADKFTLVAFMLCSEGVDQDSEKFKKINKERNNLSHGQDVVETALPVEATQKMVRKYLQLHLGYLH
jgi:hypothetical protein